MSSFLNSYILPWSINIAMAVVIFFIGRLIASWLVKLTDKLLRKANVEEMLVNFITSILNVLLLLFIIVAALKQLGIDTTSLIALVGAAGLAIGLSLQDSLKNFAAGVMLVVFKPFKEGDFVETAGVSAVVERIQIFNTLMKTADNREVIVPNGVIYSDVIVNYSAKDKRRVDMVFGIGYDDDLRKAKNILENILLADKRVLQEPNFVVAVSELGDNSVNFVVRPWVNSADYWAVLWDTTEAVKLQFDEANISIPYPQMDIHIQGKNE